MKKISIKREQSQAGLSFAERLRVGEPCSGMREKFRPQVKNKILLLLALLLTAATGAWAQTTHVVKQENVNTIFSGDGYTLGNAVKAGDVLDFQGTIELEGDASHSLVINKQVTVISSTKDAVVKLHTVAGSLTGDDPGNCFVINKAGSGTTVQDIRLENTEMWIFNTSNVTFTGVTMHVEDARVGSGVGHVALRYSDHVTVGGSNGTLVLTSGTLTATGGNGGSATSGQCLDDCGGGSGASAISGSLTINGGTVTRTNGSNGTASAPCGENYNAGSGAAAVAGSVTDNR